MNAIHRAAFAVAVAALAAGAGCAEPKHLGYDFGRAYTDTFTLQADLTRPSVATEQYALYGLEGTKIRLLVEEASTGEESGKASIR